MLKFLLLTILFVYVIYKASNFVLKLFFPLEHARRMQQEHARKSDFGPKHRRQQQQHSPEGHIHVDHVPEEKKKERSTQDFKGGEYVDYEEVK